MVFAYDNIPIKFLPKIYLSKLNYNMGCVNNTSNLFCKRCISMETPTSIPIQSNSPMNNKANQSSGQFADFFQNTSNLIQPNTNSQNIQSNEDKSDTFSNQKYIQNDDKNNNNGQNGKRNSKKEIIKPPSLKLLFISNSITNPIEEVTLTPNSLKKRDGNVIIKSPSHKFSFGKDPDNDCVLPDSNLAGKQFFVFYNETTSKFNVLDNLSGTGLFVKIENSLIINHDMIVSFCADHMYLQVTKNSNNSKDIRIKFLQGKRYRDSTFNSDLKKIITIGRGNKCDIKYDGDSVSKIHCTIKFIDDNWVMYDGTFANHEQKKSTNGLWLLANVGIELNNKMLLTSGIYKIKVEIEEPSKSLQQL